MGKLSRFDSLKTLGKYRLMEKLSDDPLGPVYKSFDRDLDRAVEIRIFCDGIKWDTNLAELLQKACRSVTRLQHTNIASIIELNTEETSPYMVLESLGKRNLRNLTARTTKMSFESKISIMMQLTQGLAFAHRNAIIHRNLCPENIYLKADGCIKIRDFNLSHVLGNHLPHPGVRYGAPIYLSPEQIEHKPCNEQSDIFALGTVSYELLTGSHPFYDADSNKLLDNILQDRPIPTFDRYPHFHPRIWHILKKCLEKNPEDRYGNADEILNAFQDMLKEMTEDVHLMLAELQASFPSLKTASESPNATKKFTGLYRDIWNILRGVDDREFVHLDKLVSDLNEIYPEIQAFTRKQDTNDSVLVPRIRPEDLYMSSKESSPVADKENASSQQYGTLRSEGEVNSDSFRKMGASADTNQGKDDQKEDSIADATPGTASSGEYVPANTSRDTIPGRSDSMDSGPGGNAPATVSDIHAEKPDRVSSVETPIAVPNNTNQASIKSDPQTCRKHSIPFWRNKGIPKRRYRIYASLLLILLVFGSMHIFQGTGAGKTTLNSWKDTILGSWMTVKASVLNMSSSEQAANASISIENVSADDSISSYESALMDGLEEEYPVDSSTRNARQQLVYIRTLIGDGALNHAEEELDRMRRVFPGSPDVEQLYELLEEKRYRSGYENNPGENVQTKTSSEKDKSWNLQYQAAFSKGEYGEAENVVNLWMRNVPGSARAHESAVTLKKLQTKIASSNLALSEHRYREALFELDIVEKINPSDPNIPSMRKKIESRLPSEQSVLSIMRLGDRATLLLDGERIGTDGEVRNARIPIGKHTIRVEKDGYLISSRSQTFYEDQAAVLVYDLVRREIRPIVESDRKFLSQREAMEKVHSFPVEHEHGFLKGNCHGVLLVSYSEVVYQPSSGDHGFRVPFKILKLRREGATIFLSLMQDNELFQKLILENEYAAIEFNQTWTALKSLP